GETLRRAVVAGVADVPQREGRGRGPDEFRARPEDGTGGIAEHAVDAQALLPVRVDILRILGVLLRQVAPIFSDDVRSDRGQLVEEVVEVDDEVLEDREVRKGFDGDRALAHVPDVGAAGEPRAPVDVRAAGPADPHATGPPEGEGRIEMIRSEEHTSELQSRSDLVCRLL